MLPVLILLHKNKLKSSLVLFGFLMSPIFLKIYISNWRSLFFGLLPLFM